MIKPSIDLRQLAERARQEPGPSGDVTQQVLNRIQHDDGENLMPLVGFAALSATAASLTLVSSYFYMATLSDPMASIFKIANIIVP